MRKKRPCDVCRRWFLPHARAGSRQTVCSDPACQRERHRRSCACWRQQNPDYDRDRRLRERIVRDRGGKKWTLDEDPMRGLDLEAVRDAVPLEVLVLIDESAGLLSRWCRDAVSPQPSGIIAVSAGHPPPGQRDELVGDTGPP